MFDRERFIKTVLSSQPWKHFEEPTKLPANNTRTDEKKAALSVIKDAAMSILADLSADARILAFDLVTHTDSLFRDRIVRMSLSVRRINTALDELVGKHLAFRIWVGKILLPAPAPKLFVIKGEEAPYAGESESDIQHPFLCHVASRLIKANPLVQLTNCNVPMDNFKLVDLVAQLKNGQRLAYEITLSTSNVSSNAAKFINKGFYAITFVCRDFDVKQAVLVCIQNAGFDPNFKATLRYTLFSSLFKQKKQFSFEEKI